MIDTNNPVAMAEEIARLRGENARLLEVLLALVKAEDEYGDADNVAVNEAWQPAFNLLHQLGKL